MLWVKAFHIIFMVSWFGGLFYLPRLFTYHAMAKDSISIERFKIMEKKLYHRIMMPSMTLTILFGIWLLSFNFSVYMKMLWFHLKLSCVLLLLIYHFYLGYLGRKFKNNQNKHSHVYYRIINEFPILFLTAIVILVIVKPFGIV